MSTQDHARETAERLAMHLGIRHPGQVDRIRSALLAERARAYGCGAMDARDAACRILASRWLIGGNVSQMEFGEIKSNVFRTLDALAARGEERQEQRPDRATGSATGERSLGEGNLGLASTQRTEAHGNPVAGVASGAATAPPSASPAPPEDARAEMVERARKFRDNPRAGNVYEAMADFALSETVALRARLAEKDAEIERLKSIERDWHDEVARFNRGWGRRAEPYEALEDEFEQMGYAWANFDKLRKELAVTVGSDVLPNVLRRERDALRKELEQARAWLALYAEETPKLNTELARAREQAEDAKLVEWNGAIGEAYNATFECGDDIKDLRQMLLARLRQPAPDA